MQALAIIPGKNGSVDVVDMPKPQAKPGHVLIKMLEAGICGTDAEINAGLYGEAPRGESVLVLGHEGLGRMQSGQLVVPMVRRPCPECANCKDGGQDMCSTGKFTERGIKAVHGMISEFIVEDPAYLIPVPESARPYAVLMEPMSVAAKGIRQAQKIQGRLQWEPRRALVLGAGPIGLLAAFTLRVLGWEVTAAARKPQGTSKAALMETSGARYVSLAAKPLPQWSEQFDFVFEATGSSEIAFQAFERVAINGILCWTSITGGSAALSVPADRINFNFVLGNKLAFGTVNAARQDFEQGLIYLQQIEKKFPGLIQKLFTGRAGFENARDLFEIHRQGIKTLFQIEPR